jgi:hypothetical protein
MAVWRGFPARPDPPDPAQPGRGEEVAACWREPSRVEQGAQPGGEVPAQPGYPAKRPSRGRRCGAEAGDGAGPAGLKLGGPGGAREAGARGEPAGRPSRGGALAHAGCSGLHWLSRPSYKYSGLGLLYAGLGSCLLTFLISCIYNSTYIMYISNK